MATNKNITMMQYNGTDYDTLYPQTLVSQTLGNWDLNKVTGVLGVSNGGTGVDSIDMLKGVLNLDSYTKIQFGQYVGTGTYGSSNPNSITFKFPIDAFQIFYSSDTSGGIDGLTGRLVSNMIPGSILPTSYTINQNVWFDVSSNVWMKISSDGKTISWFSDGAANLQYNGTNVKYYWIGISATGGSGSPTAGKQYLLTNSSGSFTVPATGKYYLELHGGGGGGLYHTGGGSGAQGGLSCSIYNSINLTKGTVISYTCGTGGVNTGYSGTGNYSASNGNTTTFGSYSCAGGGGGKQTSSELSGGTSGGTNGVTGGITSYNYSTNSFTGVVYGTGHNWRVTSWGIGGYGDASSGIYLGTNGTNGCVLLEYLGT